jgi:hypothetical protein
MNAIVKTHALASDDHRVLATIRRDTDQRYVLTVIDAKTAAVLGRVIRSPNPTGGPPCFEVADILEKVGGKFRHGHIEIQLGRKKMPPV